MYAQVIILLMELLELVYLPALFLHLCLDIIKFAITIVLLFLDIMQIVKHVHVYLLVQQVLPRLLDKIQYVSDNVQLANMVDQTVLDLVKLLALQDMEILLLIYV